MRKRFKESEIINLLREIEVKISGGMEGHPYSHNDLENLR